METCGKTSIYGLDHEQAKITSKMSPLSASEPQIATDHDNTRQPDMLRASSCQYQHTKQQKQQTRGHDGANFPAAVT